MNPPIQVTFGNPDPSAAPINITELVQLLNNLVMAQILGSYTPYVMSDTTPGVEDQDKQWLQLDNAGRPIAIKKFYNGNWRRVYNGMIGEIRAYHGNPATDFNTDGLGNVGGTYDGWHLCNGNNGTPDLSDKFLIAGHMNNAGGHVGYSSGWQTFVDGETDQKTGGENKTMITAPYLPELDVTIHGHEYKSDADHTPDVSGIVDVHYANLITHDLRLAHYGADPGGTPSVPQKEFPILPPFIAMGYIIFVGY